MAQSWLTTTSTSWVQVILLPQSPEQLGLQACPPLLANFVFLVEMGFLYVGQADLELLTSGDPSTSASQCWDYRLELLHLAQNIFLD